MTEDESGLQQTAHPDKAFLLLKKGLEMRTGRKLGRTLYVKNWGSDDPDHDVCVGIVDSPAVAKYIVDAVNERQGGRADASDS